MLCIINLAAAYTYYKSLCSEEALKRRGKHEERKVQRRRRERLVRVRITALNIDLNPIPLPIVTRLLDFKLTGLLQASYRPCMAVTTETVHRL